MIFRSFFFQKIMTAFLAFMLTGCVGVTTFTKTVKHPGENKKLDDIDRENKFKESDVIRIMGKPISIEQKEYGEVAYKYSADVAWRGILIWVIVPIPALLPVGSNYAYVIFDKHGFYKYTLYEESDYDFIGCTVAACGHLGKPHS